MGKQERKQENTTELRRTGLPEETEALLRSYFDAFANLYGITPLYRAFRIIGRQNPDLGLTEEELLAFADQIEEEDFHHYIVAGEEDIYEDVKEPTPPMKREIITEYLYAVDDFESYEELKEKQADKPFYIPEKEGLLKYQDGHYFEKTREYLALEAFLRDKVKLKRVEDVMDDLQLAAHMETSDPESVIWEAERLAGRDCFRSTKQLEEFLQYYFDMYNHTRMHANRGFTPAEMHERLGGGPPESISSGPHISPALRTGEMDILALRQGILQADLPASMKESMLRDLNRAAPKKTGR